MNQQDLVMNLQEVSGEASALSLQDRQMMTRLGSMGKKKHRLRCYVIIISKNQKRVL